MTPELLSAFDLCLGGLVVLVTGAELLVRGGTALASRLNVSPAIIGLTVIAIGTSSPELAIGIDASLKGNGALAVGNIAGTNTVNILFILGLSALMKPLALQRRTLKLDLPAMLVAAITLFVLSLDGALTRIDGVELLVIGLAYSGLLIRTALRERVNAKDEPEKMEAQSGKPRAGLLLDAVLLVGGIVIVVFGTDWLVSGGVAAAEIWGVSDAFIGLTIVAIGNLLGSSTYNIAFILGVTCLIPADGVPVPEEVLMIDMPVMIAAVIACIPVFLIGRYVSRWEGGLLLISYAIYLAYLLIART